MAMAKRKEADTKVPIDAADLRTPSMRCCSASAVAAMAIGAHDDDGRVAQRKHQPHRDGPFALLHQFAGDVVDGGDVVGVHRVA